VVRGEELAWCCEEIDAVKRVLPEAAPGINIPQEARERWGNMARNDRVSSRSAVYVCSFVYSDGGIPYAWRKSREK
jgi:hypothetical protein